MIFLHTGLNLKKSVTLLCYVQFAVSASSLNIPNLIINNKLSECLTNKSVEITINCQEDNYGEQTK